MKILFSTVVLVFLLLNTPIVNACSCGNSPTPCGSYGSADAVFVGSVQRVVDKKAKGEGGREYRVGQTAYVQVERAFKGTLQPEVVFRTEGSSCDPIYDQGERWLFYGYYNKETKTWRTAACDRSTPVENAAEDLLYLQALPKSASTTRLSGRIEHYDDDPEKGFSVVNNISGAKVTITGEGKKYEAYTNKDGVFEIYGLPAGKYAVEPEIPVGLKLRFPMYAGSLDYSDRTNPRLVLVEKSCASASFILSSNNRIAGRIFGADGRVLPNVCLSIQPKEKTATNRIFDCTDKEGRYELKQIPAGEYLIVVNYHGKISSDEPFPMTYFPGVFEKDKATILTIARDSNLEDYDVHIPSQENRKTIEGVLLYSDGKPAAGEFVEFRADQVKDGYDGKVHTSTDDQGRFTLNVLEGLKGKLRGSMWSYVGEYADCPQLDNLLKAKGSEHGSEIGTKPVSLEITRDMQDIKLTFPFPYCKKAKEEK